MVTWTQWAEPPASLLNLSARSNLVFLPQLRDALEGVRERETSANEEEDDGTEAGSLGSTHKPALSQNWAGHPVCSGDG